MSSSGKSPMEQLFGKNFSPAGGAPQATTNSSTRGTKSSPHHSPTGSGKRRRNKPGKKAAVAPGTPQTPPAKRHPPHSTPNASAAAATATSAPATETAAPAILSILVTRTDLYDDYGQHRLQQQNNNSMVVVDEPSSTPPEGLEYPRPPIAEFSYTDPKDERKQKHHSTVANAEAAVPPIAIVRVPPSKASTTLQVLFPPNSVEQHQQPPPPLLDPSIQKYWKQRRRLFRRFDQGIQLDQEGWFSVTPEQIAHHVAARMVDLFHQTHGNDTNSTMTVLDAFGGCGGNTLALAQHPAVAQVICVDIDRSKLQRAAQNAAIYEIPTHKIVFVECNVIFLLEYCYQHGAFQLDQPIDSPEAAMAMMAAMPPPVPTEMVQGYQVGGIDTLPRKIDAVFMDPPWGGVDYEVFGKQGYCLERNMLIPRPAYQKQATNEGVGDAFFDTFAATQPRNKKERKAAFNCGLDATNCVNGAELLALAAQAAPITVYDIPRNTNRMSLGQAAIKAGFRGNCKLEEHYLNGRLKTVTAYFGMDWRNELLP